MEKIMFMPNDSAEPPAFYVLEQTRIGGASYILVTDSEEGSLYEIVEDEVELMAVSKVFEELLEDVGIEM